MSLDIADALSEGLRRTFERNGLLIAGLFALFGLLDAVGGQTLSAATARFTRSTLDTLPGESVAGPAGTLPGPEATPLALPVALPVALGLVAVLAFVAEALRIVAVRTFVSDETETIPEESFARNLLVATVNGFVGGVVVLILVGVGLLLLIVPGVYLALAFFFVRQEIAVADRNFLDALSGSWELTAGHRLSLFGLALVVFVVGLLVTLVGGLVGLAGLPVVTTVVNALLGALTTAFGVAVTSRAYVQLSGDDDGVEADAGDDSEWEFGPA
jgi:hypothetical protein